MTAHHYHRPQTWVVALAAVVCASCLTGCGKGNEQGAIDDLSIRGHRVNIDEAHEVVRVVAEVENRGSAPVAAVEVHAIPRSAGGSKRGENIILLKNIKPGERRVFSLRATTRPPTASVELKLVEPRGPS